MPGCARRARSTRRGGPKRSLGHANAPSAPDLFEDVPVRDSTMPGWGRCLEGLVPEPGLQPVVGWVSAGFGTGKSLEVENDGPPGKTLGHRLHHGPLLGAGQQIHPRFSGTVDPAFDCRNDLGRILNLVENEGTAAGLEKEVGVRTGIANVDVWIEDDRIGLGEDLLQQGCLADLPGAAQDDNGKCPGKTNENVFQSPIDIHTLHFNDSNVKLQDTVRHFARSVGQIEIEDRVPAQPAIESRNSLGVRSWISK